MSLEGVDVAVLCGGKGTRVAAQLGSTPKCLAPIGGRPYIDRLIDRLTQYRVARIVLCAGHLADRLGEWLLSRPPSGPDIVLSVEPEQQGTGSALRHARGMLTTNPIMVVNGDTITNADLDQFLDYHGGGNLSVLEGRRYGTSVYRSAGYYLMSQAMLDILVTEEARSLEDFVHGRRERRILRSGLYYDIGTANTLKNAEFFFENMLEVA